LSEKGFTPETNNVTEQLFSLINDVMNQARSFKIVDGLAKYCCNLFASLNKRCYNYLLFHQHITLLAEVGILRLRLNETVEIFLINSLDSDADLIQPEKIKKSPDLHGN